MARRWLVLGGAGLLSLASVWGALGLESTFDWREGMAPDDPHIAAFEVLETQLDAGARREVEVLVDGDLESAGGWSALATATDNLAEIDHIARDPDGAPLIESITMRVAGASTDNAGAIRAAVEAAVLAPHELGERRASTLVHFDDQPISRAAIRLVVDGATQGTDAQEAILAEVGDALAPLDAAGLRWWASGEPVFGATVNQSVVSSMVVGTALTLGVCLVILVLTLRSIRYATVAMLPVALVCLLLLGLMRALGWPLNVATSLILSMTIGIGVDFAIHVMHRYIDERGRGRGVHEALVATSAGLGAPMLASTATTALGIGVLALAPQDFFVRFAVLSAATISVALLVAMGLLPVLLALVDRDESVKTLYERICFCEACTCGAADRHHSCSCGHCGKAKAA